MIKISHLVQEKHNKPQIILRLIKIAQLNDNQVFNLKIKLRTPEDYLTNIKECLIIIQIDCVDLNNQLSLKTNQYKINKTHLIILLILLKFLNHLVILSNLLIINKLMKVKDNHK
jgi:hypothetical protein